MRAPARTMGLAAVSFVQDVHDLAARAGQLGPFAARLDGLRERQARKVSLLARLERPGLAS